MLANNTQHCWELLVLVASVCMGLYTIKDLLSSKPNFVYFLFKSDLRFKSKTVFKVAVNDGKYIKFIL